MHLVVFLISVATALLGTGGGSVTSKPSLRVAAKDPVAVRGQGFRPGERVRVFALGSVKRISVTRVADRRGAFKAPLEGLRTDACTRLVLTAVGSKGSRASTAFAAGRAHCPPPLSP